MRVMIAATAMALAGLPAAAQQSPYYQGDLTWRGAHAQPHPTRPDSSTRNQHSAQGHLPPHTGRAGTASPHAAPSFVPRTWRYYGSLRT